MCGFGCYKHRQMACGNVNTNCTQSGQAQSMQSLQNSIRVMCRARCSVPERAAEGNCWVQLCAAEACGVDDLQGHAAAPFQVAWLESAKHSQKVGSQIINMCHVECTTYCSVKLHARWHAYAACGFSRMGDDGCSVKRCAGLSLLPAALAGLAPHPFV